MRAPVLAALIAAAAADGGSGRIPLQNRSIADLLQDTHVALPGGLDEGERQRVAEALAHVNMSIEDLGWDKRPIDDPFRLGVVNVALDQPLALAAMAERARGDFTVNPAKPDIEALVGGIGAWQGHPASWELSACSGSGWMRIELRGASPMSKLADDVAHVDAAVRSAIPDAVTDRLRADAARAYLEDSEESWDMAPMRETAAKVDVGMLDLAMFWLGGLANRALATDAPSWRRGRHVVRDIAAGPSNDDEPVAVSILVAGPGADRHENLDVVVDLGGDDTYVNCRVVIDLGGNDTYRNCGSGFMQAGLVVDRAGDDRYLGGDITQGGAVGGVALLVDVAGDDYYDASQISQGAAVLGFGVLVDVAGNDIYRGARFVQGFGGMHGVGLLLDQSGEDTYLAGGRFKHEPLLPENYQSLSQGFGFGLRPDASGGVGLLVDQAGNDSYHAEVFGQGASYWFALGILIDSAGHDKYDLYQYGQGAGIHLSAGILMDVAGNDGYTCNNGVAQGSGHDWGVGMLWDRAGMDAYQGSGMSQGGANANGIGMILDDAGNDSYAGWNERNQGDSFPARGSVGLGLLLDLGGADKYTHGGADGATWTRGNVGVGMDWEPPKPLDASGGAKP